jgi:integrase
VNKILQNAKGEDWKYWLPRLAFYTGARRGELVGLQKKNIKFHPDLDRYYIQITSDDNKSLKTDNALRLIPLSHKIVALGFIEFVIKIKNEQEFIFGNPKLVTKKITDWFNHNLLEISGVNIVDDVGQKRVFHSTRHTFITKAIQQNVQPQLVQEIVGHDKSQGLGITARYTHRFSLKELFKVIDFIDY